MIRLGGLQRRTGWCYNEDWMVLKRHVPYGELLCCCKGIFLTGTGTSWTLFLVDQTSWGVVMSVPVPAVSDSNCQHDVSASTSAGLPSVSSKSSGD